jgi:hypothetical protein
MYIACKLGKGSATKHASFLGEGSAFVFRLLCRGVPHVPKRLMVGQSNGSFWKRPSGKEKKRKPVCTPLLIYRSMDTH